MATKLSYETLDEAVEIARSLAPKLRERVSKAEELRQLPKENVRDLLDSGLILPRYSCESALVSPTTPDLVAQ
jgi:hypothetical protein